MDEMMVVVKEEWSELQPRCSRPSPCQALFIFMREKFVCFRVVCLFFVDVTEEKRGHGVLGGTCMP